MLYLWKNLQIDVMTGKMSVLPYSLSKSSCQTPSESSLCLLPIQLSVHRTLLHPLISQNCIYIFLAYYRLKILFIEFFHNILILQSVYLTLQDIKGGTTMWNIERFKEWPGGRYGITVFGSCPGRCVATWNAKT